MFQLYVAGATPKSTQAITNLKQALDSLFDGAYELKVIDIYQEPGKSRTAGVAAVPLLIREYPLPAQRLVGDFSSAVRIQSLLGGCNPQGSSSEQDAKRNQE